MFAEWQAHLSGEQWGVEARSSPGISRSVLAARLRTLVD